MRGFLSLEDHYTADLNAYYDNLQMRLPINSCDGRHDADHSQWLEYFLATMASAAHALEQQAVSLNAPEQREAPPWESLRRIQQQLLNRLLLRGIEDGETAMAFIPGDIVEWFGVSSNTARDWLVKWREEGFVRPLRPDAERVRAYVLTEKWDASVIMALNSAGVNTSQASHRESTNHKKTISYVYFLSF